MWILTKTVTPNTTIYNTGFTSCFSKSVDLCCRTFSQVFHVWQWSLKWTVQQRRWELHRKFQHSSVVLLRLV